MSKLKKRILILFAIFTLVVMLMYIPVWIDDAEARSNKNRIQGLIAVGQQLSEVETILQDANFQLLYDAPIAPSYDQSYLQQIVIVGNTKPSFWETMAYVTGSWMPFTSAESPYLIINADLNGQVTSIE